MPKGHVRQVKSTHRDVMFFTCGQCKLTVDCKSERYCALVAKLHHMKFHPDEKFNKGLATDDKTTISVEEWAKKVVQARLQVLQQSL